MRAFSAAALAILAAILTECHSAQSDRQRHRSGPFRSIPVGADVKRDTSFDCPEEFGYYPHPTDCTLYYVCVFGGALLESCTGGLMYSHELQTCDWPRNVGCDATIAVSGDELERISERNPLPLRRTPPPPPPPRAQPNPVITSRGQPKITREEYEKQQQLYEEIDDLPPVEEIENDRQQRVYRGQPSTIGQVQRDRDGYSQVNQARTFNQNIIPASIPQNNGKIGSFSFGTQVDDRRQTVTVTQAPQTYSADVIDDVTDSESDRQADLRTNQIDTDSKKKKSSVRRKRETNEEGSVTESNTNETSSIIISDRKDQDVEDMFDPETEYELDNEDSTDRGKRQIRHGRYYSNNGFKTAGKNWANPNSMSNIDSLPNFSFNVPSNAQNIRHSAYNSVSNNYHEGTRKPPSENVYYSSANPFSSYQNDGQKPFKASLPDNTFNQRRPHNPVNSNTQIITKSPPISSLNNHDNPFAAFAAGGFFNNNPQQHHTKSQFHDSSQVSSTVVTGKPIAQTPRSHANHRGSSEQQQQKEDDDSDDTDSAEDTSSDKEEDHYEHKFPEPPYEFSHPNFKFADVVNPFAAPNFDFDAFLAKLSGKKYTDVIPTTPKFRFEPSQSTGGPSQSTSKSLSYKGMSTPRPFSVPTGGPNPWLVENGENAESTTKQPIKFEQFIQRPQQYQPNHQQQVRPQQQQQQQQQRHQQQQQQSTLNDPRYQIRFPQPNGGTSSESFRPILKQPNFNDDRQLPLNFNFNHGLKPTLSSAQYKGTNDNKQYQSGTPKPYIFLTGTKSPSLLSTPKPQFFSLKPQNIGSPQPHHGVTGKPYLVTSSRPNVYHLSFKPTTQKPLSTIANEHLSALQQFWGNHSKQAHFGFQSTLPPTVSELPKLENLFSFKPHNEAVTSTTKAPPKRKIPKPSPEMADYYYDEDEQYYYEPAVKPKYMPSSEVRPQRPPMAQNYEEYEDDSYEDESSETNNNNEATQQRKPNFKPESATKNHNDVSVVTKAPYKIKQSAKVPVPVLVDYNVTPTPTVQTRPEVSNYEIIHPQQKNRTQFRRPIFYQTGPNTLRPPKFLNQTTLRPYTVRHRLAKPTTVETQTQSSQSQDNKQTRGRTRHPNIVTQTRMTTPRDSHKQETRFTTKTRHDGRTNSLEPTESVTPASYSASPKPKMLYNGSQSYAPESYDPFYAIYDEDGELYKDTDYVQQYNTASIRPAVQQTYRGTPPPPPRRPVDSYSPRPATPDDYDDALIRGQVNQNQYQTAIRQSTRGEVNELEFDNNPSSVQTTLYEAPTISTPPPTTTSTSTTTTTTTTTQRPTVAPFTEAMTPRRSSDENPGVNINPSDPDLPLSDTSVPSTTPSVFNFSSLAKPFEKTDNLHRLEETITPTERLPTLEQTSPNNKISSESSRPISNGETKKAVSLTTGFSIRRNTNNTNNPYTLTVHTRPFDSFKKVHKPNNGRYKPIRSRPSKLSEDEAETRENSAEEKPRSRNRQTITNRSYDTSSENNISMRRKDSSSEVITEERNLPIYVRPTAKVKVIEPRSKPSSTETTTMPTKYFLKTVIKRPVPFSLNNDEPQEGSTVNVIDTDALIEKAFQNANQNSKTSSEKTDNWEQYDESAETFIEPLSPYKSLKSQRNRYETDGGDASDTTTLTSTTFHTTLSPRDASKKYVDTEKETASSKPAYYSYRLLDDYVPHPPPATFNSAAKNILKAFFTNLASSPKPLSRIVSSTPVTTTENVVNIGFHKKMLKYVDNKPFQTNQKRVEIITEPSLRQEVESYDSFRGPEYDTRTDYTTTTPQPIIFAQAPTSQTMLESTTNNKFRSFGGESYDVKATPSMTTQQAEKQNSMKFYKVISEQASTESIRNVQENVSYNTVDNESTRPTKTYAETVNSATERDSDRRNKNAYPTTTSSTRSTTPRATDPTTSTKSLSFPTRASRVNPAIKLAATNAEGGRGRSYQSTKCSSDNSLQENPKCNEIKYQRPSPTRGRGSAHYSTLGGNEQPQPQQPNRGTPPTRSRPTLKPSTAIVTKTQEYVDVYNYPPRRPSSVYPQPTPDKTAAKCRKDVCLLPDCYCGGKEIPGDMPVESVPQLVLLTFDDSVNDLNKGLYADLFEKGRVNPNGCPISATFYVSHEWTDYSQVQNLYAAGHEMASHTISHSFGEQFSQKKWNREVGGQREILAAYGGVKLEDVRGMRAPFLSVGGNKMFKMLYDSNFTYDSSLPVYENRPPSWPYTLDYKLFHDCMIPPCPTKSYPGVWEVPMVMWQDLNGGRCSMGDACANPPNAEGVYKMLLKNFDRHYTTNRAPFGLFYHAAWFTHPHHKEGFIMFLDFINQMNDVWVVTNWQALQWVRDATPISRLNNFQPFQCDYPDRPKKCNNPKVCNLWHKSGVRYMRTCQPCPEVYPWTGKTGIRSSRIDNDIEE